MRLTDIQPEAVISGIEGEPPSAGSSQPEGDISVLDLLAILVARRRFIVQFVVGAALLATVVAFLLPVRYEAKVVLLPPAQNSSIGTGLLNQLGSMGGMGSLGSLGSMASLAGGGISLKNPADMYVSL